MAKKRFYPLMGSITESVVEVAAADQSDPFIDFSDTK